MTAPVTPPRSPTLLYRLALVGAVVAAYANTFRVPFVFDDVAAITQNQSLTSFIAALAPPPGLSTTGRPLVNLSLALNHAVSGESVWSYHALNLALHLANTFLLFALLRRTLRSLNSRPSTLNCEATAFTATLLWSLHPLHTATVSYVMQRTELLAASATVLSLYAFIRAASPICHPLNDKPPAAPRLLTNPVCHLMENIIPARRPAAWLTLSVLAALAGMASKETAVVIPALVLLSDRTFVSLSFYDALRTRPRYYASLAATWFLLAALFLGTDNRGASAGLAAALPWPDYALTQLWAFGHYLRLTLWPSPLIFDYGTLQIHDLSRLALPALVLLATLIFTLRLPLLRFCSLTFLLLLAPTSLVPIATQCVAEHRLYLALTLPAVLVALALHRLLAHRTLVVSVPLAASLAIATYARNTDYRSAISLWSDTAAKLPTNARAHYNLAVHLLADSPARDPARAATALAETLRLEPAHLLAPAKLGAALLELGRPADAVAPLQTAVRLTPDSAPAHYQLAAALISADRAPAALPHLAAAVRLNPTHAAARANYGRALAAAQRYAEALAEFDEAARLDPNDASARENASRLRTFLSLPPR